MQICADAEQLRKALAALERAEGNGFQHCLAVFTVTIPGERLSDSRLTYSDLRERAHPTRGDLDFGRFQGVTERYRFVGGKVVPIKEAVKHDSEDCPDLQAMNPGPGPWMKPWPCQSCNQVGVNDAR